MIEGDFDSRTLANMNVALDRVCGRSPIGEHHELRKHVAQSIIRCAKSGRTTLGALTEAGERALTRLDEKTLRLATRLRVNVRPRIAPGPYYVPPTDVVARMPASASIQRRRSLPAPF